MASETITRNDLTAILNEVLPPNIAGIVPDYGSAVSITSLPYTAPSFGIITYAVGDGGGGGSRDLLINGKQVALVKNVSGEISTSTALVSKGDVVSGTYGVWGAMKFSPYSFAMANSADYVVEQGTSGIWTYRKWASGVAECWGKKQVAGTYSSWGNVYTSDIPAESYPTGLFVETPNCLAQAQQVSGNSISSIEGGGTQSATPGIMVMRGTNPSGTQTFNAFYQVKGRWK